MTQKVLKITLIPVAPQDEFDYLVDSVKDYIGKDVIRILDGYSARYIHDVPWDGKFLVDPKFYLYRVTIGAIGRLKTCDDAIRLGIMKAIPAQSNQFTSTSLYYVYRVARQARRMFLYLQKLEKGMNATISGKSPNTRMLELINEGKE
ncbi:MAG: hypothetical protein FVQ80_11395 [Planctomycetes bacterium]|nr:hypothetical protein [Planctomycetota bacterium]